MNAFQSRQSFAPLLTGFITWSIKICHSFLASVFIAAVNYQFYDFIVNKKLPQFQWTIRSYYNIIQIYFKFIRIYIESITDISKNLFLCAFWQVYRLIWKLEISNTAPLCRCIWKCFRVLAVFKFNNVWIFIKSTSNPPATSAISVGRFLFIVWISSSKSLLSVISSTSSGGVMTTLNSYASSSLQASSSSWSYFVFKNFFCLNIFYWKILNKNVFIAEHLNTAESDD